MTAIVKQGVSSRPGEQQITWPEAALPVDITQFGHSLYHAFLDYCKLGSPKKVAAQQAGWVPHLSQKQFTALASDLALLSPRGPLQPQAIHSIHARCRPAGSPDLTFAAFLQAIAGLAAAAEVPPDAVFAATATLAQERPSREIQEGDPASFLHSSMSYVASPAKRPLSAEKRPTRPTTAPISGAARNQRQGSNPRSETSERFSNLKVRTNESKFGSHSSQAWEDGLYDGMTAPISPISSASPKDKWYIKGAENTLREHSSNDMPTWAQKLLDRMVSLETEVCKSKAGLPRDRYTHSMSPLISPKATGRMPLPLTHSAGIASTGKGDVGHTVDSSMAASNPQQQLTTARQVADMHCTIERLTALLSGLADRQAELEFKLTTAQPMAHTDEESVGAGKTAEPGGHVQSHNPNLSGRVAALGTSCSTLSAQIAAISQVASSAYAASKDALSMLGNVSSMQETTRQSTEAIALAGAAMKQAQEFETGLQSLRHTVETLQAQQTSVAALQQPCQRDLGENTAMQKAIRQLQSDVAALRIHQNQPGQQQQSVLLTKGDDSHPKETLETLQKRMDGIEHTISCENVHKRSNDALLKQLQQRMKKLESRLHTMPTTADTSGNAPGDDQGSGSQVAKILDDVETNLQAFISTVSAATEQMKSGHHTLPLLSLPLSQSQCSKLSDPLLQNMESALQQLTSSIVGQAAVATHTEAWSSLVQVVDQLRSRQHELDTTLSKATKEDHSKMKDLTKRLASVETKVSKLRKGDLGLQLTTAPTSNTVGPKQQQSARNNGAVDKDRSATEQLQNTEYANLVDGKLAQLQAQVEALDNQMPGLIEQIMSVEQQQSVSVSKDQFVRLTQQVDTVAQQLSDLQGSCTAAATSSAQQAQAAAACQTQVDSCIERLDHIEARSAGESMTMQVLEASIQRVGQQLDDLQHLDMRVAELAQDLQRLSEVQHTIQKAKADSWDAAIKELAGKLTVLEEDLTAQKEARRCIAAATGTSLDGQPAAGNLNEEIVQQVCELRRQAQSKGPQGYVPREEMMRALGTMATELTGRVKDIKHQVDSERSSRTSLHRQVSSKEDLVRAVAKSGMEVKQELERLKQAMEIYQVRLQDVEASVQEKATAVPHDNNNTQDVNRDAIVALQQYAEGNFRSLAAHNEQLDSRVQQHAQRLAAIDHQHKQQQQAAAHTASAAHSDSQFKAQLDATTHKVDEVASALVMVAEKMNDRVNKLEGQFNNMHSAQTTASTNQNRMQPPVSPSLAFGLAPPDGWGQSSQSPHSSSAPGPQYQQDSAPSQTPMRGGGSGAYLPGMQRPPSAHNADDTVAASRPKSAQEKVALLVAEKRGEQKRLEQQLKSDEERVRGQRAAAASRIKPTGSGGSTGGLSLTPESDNGYGKDEGEETDDYMLTQQRSPKAFGLQGDGSVLAANNHASQQQPTNQDEQQHSFAAELEAMGRSNGGNYLQGFEEQLQDSNSRLDTGGVGNISPLPVLTLSPLPSPPLHLSPSSITGARQLQTSSSISVRPASTPQVALSVPARNSLSGPPVRMSDNGIASGRLTLDSPRQKPSAVAIPGMMMGQNAAMSPARMAAMQQQQHSMMVMKKQQQQQQQSHLRKL